MKRNITRRNWISFIFITLVYLGWVVWMQNYWLLLVEFLWIDIYLTRFIHWDAWRKMKKSPLRTLFEWIDAIGFALIAVYFINTFLFQNYQIPTSSLEKSLLVGDYLAVSKVTYGPRVPNTPLSFPLAQHTLPLLNCKSYIETPQLPYKRLKGLRKIERNDIVVFNFPAGDTVCLKMQNSDYYTLCAYYGREQVKQDKATFGDIIYRPVDRRENYVKRCIGLPGDSLQIIDNQVYIDGQKLDNPLHLQWNYLVETNGRRFTEKQFRELGVSKEDREMQVAASTVIYRLPLTQAKLKKLKTYQFIKKIVIEPVNPKYDLNYPVTYNNGWTRDNYGPLWIPKKGATIALTPDNIALYKRVIRNYEKNQLEIKGDVAYINGKLSKSYTFKMDYYWMMGDNRHKSADSRSWGFVPEDHVVGTPMFVWLSLDKDRSWFSGKIRWRRLFHTANYLSKH